MVWSLVLLTSLVAQEKPAATVADKPAAAVAEPAGPPLKSVAKPNAKAQPAAPANPPAPDAGGSNLIFWLAPGLLIFWFMLIRPQRKQEAKLKDLLNNLKKNDKVQTSAGIFGTVVSTDPASDKVVVRVDDDKGVKLTFSKASIVRVIDPQPEKAADTTS